MTKSLAKIIVAGSRENRELYFAPADTERLDAIADWSWLPCEAGETAQQKEKVSLIERVEDVEGIVVSPGAPRIDAAVIEAAPKLRFIGEMNGDRFARLIDVETAWKKGIRTVDTTNGSSYPVAEWALGLILVSLRNAGFYMRAFLQGNCRKTKDNPSFLRGELTGKRVGLIGCGHVGRRLVELLRPFKVDIQVHDPYLPVEMAEVLGVVLTSLESIMSKSDVIVCVAPLTPKTQGMIGQDQLELIPPETVLVNVSRGPIIDSEALVARLKRGDIIAGLDVFDPDPIPPDHEVVQLENVFLTPHIAGVTDAAYKRFFTLMVDELERFLNGNETYYDLTPRSLANRQGSEYLEE